MSNNETLYAYFWRENVIVKQQCTASDSAKLASISIEKAVGGMNPGYRVAHVSQVDAAC